MIRLAQPDLCPLEPQYTDRHRLLAAQAITKAESLLSRKKGDNGIESQKLLHTGDFQAT